MKNFKIPILLRVSIFICCLLLSLYVFSQDTLNILPVVNMKDTVLPKKRTSIKPTGDFDQRFSVFGSNKNVNIWGYRIGVLVNDKVKVGIGGYFVKSDYDTNIYKTRNQTQNFTQKSQINQTIYYGTMYLEPYLIRKKQ